MGTDSATELTAAAIWTVLRHANSSYQRAQVSELHRRQPVHVVYGGGHLFKANTLPKLARIARESLQQHAPNSAVLSEVFGWRGTRLEPLAEKVYQRVVQKLEKEAIEDFRIDFEDGYGYRPDAEEDRDAEAAAIAMAEACRSRTLPSYSGIRIKSFSNEGYPRASRTLELFVTRLAGALGGRLPDGFTVTLPKVTIPEQVTALKQRLELLESSLQLPAGNIELELMVETPHALIDPQGTWILPQLVRLAEGRCRGVHLGVYDYTAACGITSASQGLIHPVADFARNLMQVGLTGSGVMLSDGATQVIPAGDSPVVLEAWRLHYRNVRYALDHGYYQGWDLHPAQLIPRYAAVYSYFLENLPSATERLKGFTAKAAQTAMLGSTFDDAATGQGLLNFFVRGLNCGAVTETEALATGLTQAELRMKSFVEILSGRKGQAPQS